ncbi:MAG: hypothetical protein V4724_25565 [Pseudomonadota bacterium]
MAARSHSSKTAAIAGTLAGLLAAGLGAYYLHTQRPSHPDLPSMQVASNAPTALALAAPAASKDQAVERLMALPELQAWSLRIEKNSGGQAHGAVIEYDPKPRVLNGKHYFQFSFIENSNDAAQRWESFLVSQSDGEILVDDDVNNDVLSLERWRQEKQPLQRNR